MFGIFSNVFKTATRTSDWDAPTHWKRPKYPHRIGESERETAEARRRAMRSIGMW